MTSQIDRQVKDVFDAIVARTPPIGDAPNDAVVPLAGDHDGRSRSRVALAGAAALVLCLGGLLASRAVGGAGRESTANSANVPSEAPTTVYVEQSSSPPVVASSTPAATPTPTVTEPEPASTTTSVPVFEPLRPGAVQVKWLPPGYTQSEDTAGSTASVQQIQLSAPTDPADDVWVRVDRDAAGSARLQANRPASAIDVPVRGGIGYVEVVSDKKTTMLVFLDADGVVLIIYAPDTMPADTLVRIADGLN